jgi:hypothetical protein
MGSTVIRLTGIVVALAACGDDAGNRKIMDAPAIGRDEGQIDSPAASPVTVTVKNQAGPTENIEVYFQNADSTVVATAHTDANGIASQVMDAGGFVTLVNPYLLVGFGGGNQLVTWAGVKPGDHLVLDNSSVQMFATVTFQLPLAVGAASYNFYASCNNTMLPYSTPTGTGISSVDEQVSLYGCGGTADLLLVASDIDNQPVSYFYVPAQPINDGDTIDYTAKTFTAVVQRAFEFDNNASPNNPVTIGDQFITSRGQVFQQQNLPVGGTTVATTFFEPGLPTGALDVVTTQQTVANTTRNTVAWGPTAADYTADYAASLLGDFTVDPSLDTGTHAISWTLGAGKAAQFAFGEIFASRLSATGWSWQIVGPSGTQLQLPTLPTDVADFNIVATDSFTIGEADVGAAPGGYDAYRANAFAGPPGVIGASGTAAFNQWQAPPSTARSVAKKLFAPKRVVAPRRAWQKH